MAKTCYMCDAPKTSKEHVPPRCLFPAEKEDPKGIGSRRNLVTVPSCDVHNSRKSKDDEYILYVLALNIANNQAAENHFNAKIRRAIENNPAVWNRLKSNMKPVVARDQHTGQITSTVALGVDMVRFNSAMDHLGRALYFHHFKCKWPGRISVYPDFLLFMDTNDAQHKNAQVYAMAEMANLLLADVPSYGENPEIFRYQVADGNEEAERLMRLYFYDGARVTLILWISKL